MRELLCSNETRLLSRRTFLPAFLAVATLLSAGSQAFANNLNRIHYFGHQPAGKPAFGQTILITGQITRGDRGPVANQRVELWFSGRTGIRAGSVFTTTDRFGRFAVNMTIPSSWRFGTRNGPTWVDLNVSCPSIGRLQLFRVRDK